MRSTTLFHVGVVLLLATITLAGCSPGQDSNDVSSEGETSVADVLTLDESANAVSKAVADTVGEAAGMSRTDALIAALTIFVVAVFLGFELITKVPPTLHTPLMSGSNAISGITVVGAVLMAGCQEGGMAAFFGMIAVAMAMVNVVGGFMVTDRMLSMFKKK